MWFGFEGMVAKPMHKLWDTIKVLPTFALAARGPVDLCPCGARVKDERLRMALSFHPLFIGGDPMHVTSMYALVAHLEKEFGVHYAMGGVQAIADAMASVIRAQGGLVRQGAEVDEILVDERCATGVRLTDGEPLPRRHCCQQCRCRPHLRPSAAQSAAAGAGPTAKLTRTRWSMGLFVWYFGTKGTAGKWADVGHHTILNGPRYKGLLRDIFMQRQTVR